MILVYSLSAAKAYFLSHSEGAIICVRFVPKVQEVRKQGMTIDMRFTKDERKEQVCNSFKEAEIFYAETT